MMKPIINLDELVYEPDGPNLPGSSASVASKIGAKKLGYNVTLCPPGKSVCPHHNHHINEELFFILEGSGTLRFGTEEYQIRAGDFVACPPGGRDVAHQIINTGTTNLKYIALSSMLGDEVCEYPDSNKVGVYVGGKPGQRLLSKLFIADTSVDYYVGETAECLWEKKK